MIDILMRRLILAQLLPFWLLGVQTPGSREMTLVSAAPECLAGRMTISTSRPRAFRNRNNRSVEKPSSLPRMRAEILGWSMPRRLTGPPSLTDPANNPFGGTSARQSAAGCHQESDAAEYR